MFRGAVVLNGGSSSGKTSIVRHLQELLEEPWLTFGIDGLLASLPAPMLDTESSIQFEESGNIVVGPEFRRLERAWMAGIAAMVRAGANVLIDEVFLEGNRSQARWVEALGDVPSRFIAVRCAAEAAVAREAARGDRLVGLAVTQVAMVHDAVSYDFSVDTTTTSSDHCAKAIAAYLAGEPSP
jgi:chloramphenicol 3-O phosphotransferase